MAYVAIHSTDPLTRDILAYGCLLIRESQRHGGNGWLDYDRVFRQQVAIDALLRWNTLHPGIQASTLVTNAPGPGAFCTLCRENDHGVHCLTSTSLHSTHGRCLSHQDLGHSRRDALSPSNASVYRGTKVDACTLALAHSGTFVPHATSGIWQKIVGVSRVTRNTGGTFMRCAMERAPSKAVNRLLNYRPDHVKLS